MFEPDYTDYSLDQLHDCLAHINQENYPERYQRIQQEIALRQAAGEVLSDPSLNELIAVDVPLSLGIRAWWCFTWRVTLASLAATLLFLGFAKINALLRLFSPATMEIMYLMYNGIVFILAGTLIMMQVLAKRYQGYRLRIIKIPL